MKILKDEILTVVYLEVPYNGEGYIPVWQGITPLKLKGTYIII